MSWSTVVQCTLCTICQRRKFKRVSLNKTPEFPFCDLYIFVDKNVRISINWYLQISLTLFTKPWLRNRVLWRYSVLSFGLCFIAWNLIWETRVLKLVFTTIPCLKLWALCILYSVFGVLYMSCTLCILCSIFILYFIYRTPEPKT